MVLVSSRMRSCVTGSLPFAVIALHGREHGETAGGDQGSRSRLDPFGAPVFSCKQQEKNRRPGTTWRRWLSRKLRDDHGKCARPAPRGSARIAVHNRTKQDE